MPYAKNGDINIYYEVEGEGEPIVFIHGGTASMRVWKENGYVDSLKSNYQIILLDLRGHGNSDKPHNPDAYNIEYRTSDVTTVMDACGISSAHLLGYSYGGFIALELAKLVPERIRSMIVGGIGPQGRKVEDPNPVRKRLEAGKESYLAQLEQAGPIPAWRREQILANDFEALIALLNSPWPNLVQDLPNMTMPFLVFVGEEDELWPYKELKELYQNLPDMTFLLLPGLQHTQVTSRSDLILPHVKEFLARVS